MKSEDKKIYPYGQFSWKHLACMRSGIETFNQQKYWECHEELEHEWLEDRNDSARYVYWAVIQVAATMIHYRDKKIIGCLGMLKKSQEKFRKCRELNVLTDITFEYLSWERLENLVLPLGQESALSDFESLYQFRFTNYPFDQFPVL
ncbi:MAG: DUF309 domain-containing protein [Bacteriovoracaceae bacterium]|nr:DUF309 domain-containing protein [Bacteriovoracaceae bacterium]